MDVSTKMFLQVLVILSLCSSLTRGNVDVDNMEPGQCISRFDYDYRVLQKLLELENSMKNVTDKVAEHSTQIRELTDEKTEKTGTCSDGWLEFKDSCYLFFDIVKTTFAEAVRLCNFFGAHVVFVENFEENAFLKNQMRKLTAAHWWIGITDQETEGVWKTPGTNKLATFTDWTSGNPSNSGNEDCVHFNKDYSFLWNDISCVITMYTICEK